MALLDTGDFAGDPDEAGQVKTENLIEGMGMIGYDAINVGERELARGIAQFRRMTEKSKLAFTSANLVHRDNGEQLFAPYVIREHKLSSGLAVKVGYMGLTALNSAFAKETPEGRVVILRDPVEAVRLYLPALRPRVDLVVLLANLSLRDLASVLTAASGIDLALVSYGPRLSAGGTLESIAGVPVLYAGDQGKRLGEVRITFAGKEERPALSASHVFLTRRYPSEPKLQALIDRTISRVNEIKRLDAEKLAAALPAGSIPSRPAASLARGARGGAEALLSAQGTLSPRPFLTAAACASCHADAFEIYLRSAHARAFDTLVKANQDYNTECVRCHVTGYEQPQGFLNARQTPDLANVQCEACHGNGSDHAADLQKPFGKVPPRACFTCHTKENSPDFVFFKYWELIKH